MAYLKGLLSTVIGVMLLAAAGYFGFAADNWVLAIILAGAGTSLFIAGTQYDGMSDL